MLKASVQATSELPYDIFHDSCLRYFTPRLSANVFPVSCQLLPPVHLFSNPIKQYSYEERIMDSLRYRYPAVRL